MDTSSISAQRKIKRGSSQAAEAGRITERTHQRGRELATRRDELAKSIALRNAGQIRQLVQGATQVTQAKSELGNARTMALITQAMSQGGGGKVVAGKGAAARLARKISPANSVVELTSILNRLGYASPQGHHDETAVSRDFNVNKGNMYAHGEGQTSAIEQRRLLILMRALKMAFGGKGGPLSEAIFDPWGSYFGPGTRSKSPYGGHDAHGHAEFESATW